MNFATIPKYCISLKRCTQRRVDAQKEFDKAGISVTFFDAVDKKDLTLPELSTKTTGIQACMMSHIELIKKAKSEGLKAICIFEDDVIFCDDFNERIKHIESLNIDFDIFCLGGHFSSLTSGSMFGAGLKTRWENVYKVIQMGGTYGYILKENVYDFVLRNIHYNYGMDEFYGNFVYRRFKSYAFTPFLVGTRPGLSEITGKVCTYENVGWFYQQEKINI